MAAVRTSFVLALITACSLNAQADPIAPYRYDAVPIFAPPGYTTNPPDSVHENGTTRPLGSTTSPATVPPPTTGGTRGEKLVV